MNEQAKAWDERYSSSQSLWISDPDPALVRAVSELDAGRAVDIGAGEGRNTLWLAENGWSVTAIDLSQVALTRLGEALKTKGLQAQLFCGDVEDFDSGEAYFDLVVMANIHPPLSERIQLYRTAKLLLRPGGEIFIIGHHKESLGIAGPADPDRLIDNSEIADAFAGFEFLRLETIRDVSDHGHDPAPSLVFVGRRPMD